MSLFGVSFGLGSLTLIDLEYGGPNYRGFDLGDFFCEFAGKCLCLCVHEQVCIL